MASEDCIFCRIIHGDLPTEFVYEDESVVAFKDIDPQAPVHLLIIPRKHIPTLSDIDQADETLMGHIFGVVKKLASDFGVAEDGYRVVANCQENASQTVFHIHFHLLGGRKFQWPPG